MPDRILWIDLCKQPATLALCRLVVTAQIGVSNAATDHCFVIGVDPLGLGQHTSGLGELAAAGKELRVAAEQDRMLGHEAERLEDRLLGFLEPPELGLGNRQQIEQRDRIGFDA